MQTSPMLHTACQLEVHLPKMLPQIILYSYIDQFNLNTYNEIDLKYIRRRW